MKIPSFRLISIENFLLLTHDVTIEWFSYRWGNRRGLFNWKTGNCFEENELKKALPYLLLPYFLDTLRAPHPQQLHHKKDREPRRTIKNGFRKRGPACLFSIFLFPLSCRSFTSTRKEHQNKKVIHNQRKYFSLLLSRPTVSDSQHKNSYYLYKINESVIFVS